MTGRKRTENQLSENEVDEIVEAAARDETAWEEPVVVRRHSSSLRVPGDLMARAAFLARLHRERSVDEWLSRVIRERVEIEEGAFSAARSAMSGSK